MASLYPVVPRSPSSRIPTLRTSKHFRKHSSQLELLKFNLQRKIFIERENKLCDRVYSAGDAEELYHGNKRHSLPPIRDVASVGGLAQRRRRTIGEYGAGPTKLTPIKIPNKVPDRTSNRRYSRERKPSGTVEAEVINGQYKPARQVLAEQRRAEGQAKRDAIQHKEQIRRERQDALDEWEEQKRRAVEQDVNEDTTSEYEESEEEEEEEEEGDVSAADIKSSDFDISPVLASNHLISEGSTGREWNVCTEIETEREPTPLNLPDEGDHNMFRRGSASPLPPIASKAAVKEATPEPEEEEKPITTRTGLVLRQPKKKKKSLPSHQPSKFEETPLPTTKAQSPVQSNSPAQHREERKPEPAVKSSGPTADERNKMAALKEQQMKKKDAERKKKEAALMKRIADLENEAQQAERQLEADEEKKKKKHTPKPPPARTPAKAVRPDPPAQRKESLPGPSYSEYEAQELENKRVSKLAAYKQKLKEETPTNTFKKPEVVRDKAADAIYIEADDGGAPEQVTLVPCGMCGRNFNEDRLAKHTTICNKVSNKTTKVFDSSKKRSEGTEFQKYVEQGAHLKEIPKAANKKDWKKQHEEFQAIVKCARTGETAPAISNPDYVSCPHCNRSFNSSAADRHIPLCKERTTCPPPMKLKKGSTRK